HDPEPGHLGRVPGGRVRPGVGALPEAVRVVQPDGRGVGAEGGAGRPVLGAAGAAGRGVGRVRGLLVAARRPGPVGGGAAVGGRGGGAGRWGGGGGAGAGGGGGVFGAGVSPLARGGGGGRRRAAGGGDGRTRCPGVRRHPLTPGPSPPRGEGRTHGSRTRSN